MGKKSITPVELLINRLGYSDSSNLIYFFKKISTNISPHINDIIKKIKPYAYYIVDGKPFILFFEALPKISFEQLSKLVWNSQIPIVFLCAANNIRIYNGYSIDSSKLLIQLEEMDINSCNEESPFSYWNITSPEFWKNHFKKYSHKKLNDTLLENITYITRMLKDQYKIGFATNFVLRLIFIRYLIDRGVDLGYRNFNGDIEKSQKQLLKLVTNKKALYLLFSHLKEKFHGNLFDLGNELDDPKLTDEVLVLVAKFLSGTLEMSNGQYSLFPLYDFSIISVELISSIYEIMLGKQKQNEYKAFYTPNYLVDFILQQKIFPHLSKRKRAVVMDPSCGSGIFLVSIYRRMIEENLGDDLYSDNDKMLINILKNNIYGIDYSEEAIDVAIFSLYLTALDYKDPKTLVRFDLPDLREKNLFESDFFNEEKLNKLLKIDFDFIIGNPPWGKVTNGLHMQYCEEHGHRQRQQNFEICRSFVFRVKDFSNENTQCCLILHSKILYTQKKPSKEFRKYMLENTVIEKVIEMSSVREVIFENAKGPAVIVMFKYQDKDCIKNKMTYVSLKPNIFFKLFNVVVIEKNDVKHIEQNFLMQHDWAWKTVVFGFSGDMDIILSLKRKYKTIKKYLSEQTPKLSVNVGVKYADGEIDAKHLLGLKLIQSKHAINHFSVDISTKNKFMKAKIDRARPPKIFDPPHCVINKWEDRSNFSIFSSYSEVKVVFTDSVYLIKGEFSQKDLLLNLVGLFNSDFFTYLNLMLGSSTGIEREQCFKEEIIQFPCAYNAVISNIVASIQVEKEEFHLETSSRNQNEIKLNKIIFDMFNLSENEFIDYALKVQIPQLKDSFDIYRKVDADDLRAYCKCFDDHFSYVYGRSRKYIEIIFYPNVASRFTIFELKIIDTKPKEKIKFSDSNDKAILTKFMVNKHNDLFYRIDNVIYTDKSSFFIIKPNHYKNWHRAIARIDLNDVIDQIF
ncbi:MAG: SAM-dependent methyltransferase [Bacteroidales bacterium]|jgi:hypothetical protein|nr:SAM-dependent methyltransferase [Bacteroidales bacterium]